MKKVYILIYRDGRTETIQSVISTMTIKCNSSPKGLTSTQLIKTDGTTPACMLYRYCRVFNEHGEDMVHRLGGTGSGASALAHDADAFNQGASTVACNA